MSGNYDDMLYMEHPTSKVHPRMAPEMRAAQFSPFAALTGYEEAVKETARRTKARIQLSEDALAELDRRLAVLRNFSEEGNSIRAEAAITYFVPDLWKEGGEYVSATGRIKRVDDYNRCVIMEDGTVILIEDITEIEGEMFRNGFLW